MKSSLTGSLLSYALGFAYLVWPGAVIPVQAQPPEPAGASAAELETIRAQWTALREEVGKQEVLAPAEALARYRAFYNDRGHLSTPVSIEMTSLLAQITWQELHDGEKALSIYDWGLQQFAKNPAGVRRLQKEMELVRNSLKPETGAAASSALPVPEVNAFRTFTREALLAGLRAAEGNPDAIDKTWLASGLPPEELAPLIEELLPGNAGNKSMRLCLAGLLARHGVELLAPDHQPRLSEGVRLSVADYYAEQRDEKAVGLYEALLSEWEAQGVQERLVPVLEHLSWYYRVRGDTKQAAATLGRVSTYTRLALVVGNSYLEAARLYTSAGEGQKAAEFYAKAGKSGYGWAAGIALYDQASVLIRQGKYEEARKLLTTPVTGEYAEQIKVILLCKLGISYYVTGEFDLARKYLMATGEQYKTLTNPLQGQGPEGFVNIAQSYLRYIDMWAKEPIMSSPRDARLIVRRKETSQETLKEPWVMDGPRLIPIRILGDGQSLRESFMLRSYRALPMSARAENPLVQIQLTDRVRLEDAVTYAEKEMVVVVPFDELKGRRSLDVTITVNSPNFPDFHASIPIHIEVQD